MKKREQGSGHDHQPGADTAEAPPGEEERLLPAKPPLCAQAASPVAPRAASSPPGLHRQQHVFGGQLPAARDGFIRRAAGLSPSPCPMRGRHTTHSGPGQQRGTRAEQRAGVEPRGEPGAQ